jgi:hypothetical protein
LPLPHRNQVGFGSFNSILASGSSIPAVVERLLSVADQTLDKDLGHFEDFVEEL